MEIFVYVALFTHHPLNASAVCFAVNCLDKFTVLT